jgi:hypothetical protein
MLFRNVEIPRLVFLIFVGVSFLDFFEFLLDFFGEAGGGGGFLLAKPFELLFSLKNVDDFGLLFAD